MQKTALAIVVSFLFILLGFHKIAISEEKTFEQAYQDYVLTQQAYNNALSDYQKAKAFYTKNQTLALKEDARRKALTMLRGRDDVVLVYLTALRTKISEVGRLDQTEEDLILGKIDSELLWYRTHQNSYQDSDSIEDLFNKSKEVESRYKTNTPLIFYDALFNISLGEAVGLRKDHEEVFAQIKEVLDINMAEGKLEVDPFARWLTDIDSVIYSLGVNEATANNEMAKLYEDASPSPERTFTKAVEPFLYSTALLKQFNSYLNEFWTSINTHLND